MCGIAGIHVADGASAETARVGAMVNALRHRGPDGSEVVGFGPVVLGHTRLKIIDLSEAGRQPLANEDGSIFIVYNGEVYNYRELRSRLVETGHVFHSATDTEVLVHAYEEWGDAFLHKLNGMFAFALWDESRQRLLCARDRLGVKPLYYAKQGRALLFASEMKALLAALSSTPAPDERAVAEYIGLDYVSHGNRTFFDGIHQLEAGHRLVAGADGVRVEQWWDIPSFNGTYMTDPDASSVFRELFEDAVRLRLRSDVAVGSCLSGGLDSSAIVGVVDALLATGRETNSVGSVLRTFSAVFPGRSFDESRFIDAVAAATRVDEHRVTPEPFSILDAARPVVRQQDEPFGSTSILAQWELMKLARASDVTVLLDGQGGDELLAGYHSFIGFRVVDLLRRGRLDRAAMELQGYRKHQGASLSRLARLAAAPLVPGALRSRARLVDKGARAALIPRLQPLAVEDRFTVPAGLNGLAAERYRVYKRGLPALLRYEDRNSMAFAVETRLPFLDYRLVELSFRLDPALLISGGSSKQLLRRALSDRLPPEVRDRQDKIGFETPQAEWLRRDAAAVERQVSRPGFGGGYLDRSKVRMLVHRQRAGESSLSFAVWRCLCLDLWLEEVLENGVAANGKAATSHIENVSTLPTL